jgi:hypothetical protein
MGFFSCFWLLSVEVNVAEVVGEAEGKKGDSKWKKLKCHAGSPKDESDR